MTTMRVLAAAAIGFGLMLGGPAHAAGEYKKPRQIEWAFEGPFGKYDRASLQRGFHVYKQVCAACHGLELLAYRNLGDPGGPEFSEEEVKALAASFQVPAGPDEFGQTVDPDTGLERTRPATPADRFRYPFANEAAGRAANNGAYPPDLSVMVKARVDGANYLYSLLTGYVEAPEGVEMMAGMSYNPYFPGKQIAMAQPIYEGSVTFEDGTEATVDQMARDVTHFLTWAAEPKMEERKRLGLMTMIFLVVLAGLFYVSYKRVWRDVKH